MTIIFLAVGKRHAADLADATNGYTARLQRFARTEWHLVASPRASMSADAQKVAETKGLLAYLQPQDAVVLLDEQGESFTTPGLAYQLEAAQLKGVKRLVFVIGGAYGVTDELRRRANVVWSLSALVFPHQLVRLILAEQVYRASTILRGEPYHHE